MINSQDDAFRAFAQAAKHCELRDDPMKGLIMGPFFETTENGEEVWIPLPASRLVAIRTDACELLVAVSDFFHHQKDISRIFERDDILRELWYALAMSVAEPVTLAQNFAGLVKDLRAKHPPVLTVVPIQGLITGSDPIDLDSVAIGNVDETFERFLSTKCRQLDLPPFRFNDDVTWTENFVAWKENPELRGEIDLKVAPPCVAVWTSQQGSKAEGPLREKLEILFASMCYLARIQGVEGYAVPEIMSTDEYVRRRDGGDKEAGDDVDSFEFLRIAEGTARAKKEEYFLHPPREPIDLRQLLAGEENRELIKRLVGTLDGKGFEWERRFARHIQWYQLGSQASAPSTAIIAYTVALEALVGAKSTDPVTRTIAERVAYLEHDGTVESRLKLYHRVTSLYGVRSKLAHGALNAYTLDGGIYQELQDLNRIVQVTGDNFLAHAQADRWETEEKIIAWFDDCRFAGPNDAPKNRSAKV